MELFTKKQTMAVSLFFLRVQAEKAEGYECRLKWLAALGDVMLISSQPYRLLVV